MSEYRLKIHLLLCKCDHDLQPLTSDVNFLNFPNFSNFRLLSFAEALGKPELVQWPPKSPSMSSLVGQLKFKPWGIEGV